MEIKLPNLKAQTTLNQQSWERLLSLLERDEVLFATVTKLTDHQSLVLKIGNRHWDLALDHLELEQVKQLVGTDVKLELFAHGRLLITKVDSSAPYVEPKDASLVRGSIKDSLLELNIPSTPSTEAVAHALIKGGFPLKEQLIWSLVPWAEQGLVEQAVLLLRAKFPLTGELVEVVKEFQDQQAGEDLLANIAPKLSPELRKGLSKPAFENRTKISPKQEDFVVIRSFLKLATKEKLIQALLTDSNQEEYVFALPFLLKNDLDTSWVRIKGDREDAANVFKENFSIDFLLPTLNFGLVEGELVVVGRKEVQLNLWLEEGDQPFVADKLAILRAELLEQGWNPQSFTVLQGPRQGGFSHEKGSCFTL